MAATKVKQILTTNRHQAIHKKHQHNHNQIKDILQKNNLTTAKADRNKAVVIIDKTALEQKVQTLYKKTTSHNSPKTPQFISINKSNRPFKKAIHSLRKVSTNFY